MKNPTVNSLGLTGADKRLRNVPSPLMAFIMATIVGAVLLIGAGTGLVADVQSVGLGVLFYLTLAAVAGFRLRLSYEHASLGLCNIATLGRLVIVGVLFAVVISGTAPNWATFSIAVLALALDGVDGWLARRQGLVSAFGAQFDVEVDAVFALILAIYAATNGAAGYWVILLGLPHYLFWIARLRLPWLNGPLPPGFARKAVCVFQIGTLIALQVPVLADGRLAPVIGAVVLALLWSFGRDILWLWRAKQ